jgi:hypothetical protein
MVNKAALLSLIQSPLVIFAQIVNSSKSSNAASRFRFKERESMFGVKKPSFKKVKTSCLKSSSCNKKDQVIWSVLLQKAVGICCLEVSTRHIPKTGGLHSLN